MTASGTAAGDMWAAFTLRWPSAAATIKVSYGGGPYSGGSAAGADGMGVHRTFPPTACVSKAGGAVTMPNTC